MLRTLRRRFTDKEHGSQPQPRKESLPNSEGLSSRKLKRIRVWQSQARNVDIGRLQDTFLVSAVMTILVVRSQLWLTNYPQLGGGNLHIAHLLWGGALMLIAIALLLSFVGRSLRTPAAIIGGIGFGLFIDEVGKFVTADNDYFFKPSAAIIYLVFVALFLVGRTMRRRRGFDPREYLVNALDLLTEAARRPLDDRERGRALELLSRTDPDEPLVAPARQLLNETQTVPVRGPGLLARMGEHLRVAYDRLVKRRGFRSALGLFFAAWALFSLLTFGLLVLGEALKLAGVAGVRVDVGEGGFSIFNAASLASALVAGVLVVYGVTRLRRGRRLDAYRLFERALLVQIFIGQFFAFVESQFAAVFGLAIDIVLLVTVRYMIGIEQHREIGEGPSSQRASVAVGGADSFSRPPVQQQ
jgi:hypothetical protein